MAFGISQDQKPSWDNAKAIENSTENSQILFKKFIGVTLVHKTIQVSSVQLSKTSSARCIVRRLPTASPFSTPFMPPLPSSTSPSAFPSDYHHAVVCVCVIYTYGFFLNPFTFSHSAPKPPPLWQLSVCSMYPCICFYSFCSLDSTYKWDQTTSTGEDVERWGLSCTVGGNADWDPYSHCATQYRVSSKN